MTAYQAFLIFSVIITAVFALGLMVNILQD